MKNKIIIIVTAAFLWGLTSCTKKFLDDKAGSTLDETTTFTDSVNTLGFLTRIYEDIGFAYNKRRWENGANTDQGSDDTEYNLGNAARAAVALLTGGYSPVNFQMNNSGSGNGTMYELPWKNIRRANLLMSHLSTTPLSPAMQLRVKAEARFMRAYFYAYLITNFGGVPIIGNVVYTKDDVIALPRNTFEECVNYVVKELDSAAAVLPNVSDPTKFNTNNPEAAGYEPNLDYGRVTKGSCMGIKARLLLYAASPLFNGGQIPAATTAQIPLAGYPTYNVSRWQVAADAAKAIMDLAGKPYSLYTEPTPTNLKGFDSTSGWGFYQTFLKRVTPATGGLYHQEYLLVVNRPSNKDWETAENIPTRGGDASRWNPSQALVDQFPMRNGKAITDPTSGFDPARPFFNRDPRFDYSIIYNGSTYYLSSVNRRDTVWAYTGTGQTGDAYPASFTGFYGRKMCDANTAQNGGGNTDRCWGLMRYAEVLLTYAEAINEAGQTALAYPALIELRQRAGVGIGDPNCGIKLGMTQTEMRDFIRTERHIELCFEGDFRFDDIRRWKTAMQVMNIGPLKGTQVVRVGSTVPRVFTYTPISSTRPVLHSFSLQQYLFPFPLSEIQKVPLMLQNPGW
jgi:starch-binding outer membrane protein, SusD/RagB family